jgi:transcription-repair coupling factor (superfamily II helicase)
MSATPIPRTLNMSLVGVRDLSLINTAPVDRLPTRTFISKWDDETIRKAITSEIKRGGQIYFIHNRVQSIYSVFEDLKRIVPEARIRVGHGQMNEAELEDVMVQFFAHEFDVLLCTTIVESGMDNPRANTMFVDQAHMMGLSQLYQLRGRVGRSKQRAYCYLLLPKNRHLEKDAQERLKVIQENTALGSGIRIAQYDLDLRGAGDLLGEEQSGHINAVGYELYMELLDEAIHQLRGEPIEDKALDPEINLRIPALIPDNYISDIRLRLSFYKALSEIKDHEDLEKIESELQDRFGPLPEPTQNLLGIMLIRSQCKELGVRDIGAGTKSISLVFTEKTKLKPEVVIALALKQNKKYSLTPDNRLNIRMNNITWPSVYDELNFLLKL